jgi:hypothetical protein
MKNGKPNGFIFENIVKLKVEQILVFSFEPKNEQNYFLISALRIQNGSNQKIKVTIIFNIP